MVRDWFHSHRKGHTEKPSQVNTEAKGKKEAQRRDGKANLGKDETAGQTDPGKLGRSCLRKGLSHGTPFSSIAQA